MIKRVKENNYEYKHPLGTIIVDEVEIGVSVKGRRSLSVSEIERLNRLAILKFLKENYKKAIKDSDFTLAPKAVRAIIVFLRVNQLEFGQLVGCQKSKISKILCAEQPISKSQALLAMERLSMELARPGSTKRLLGYDDVEVREADKELLAQLNDLRFSTAA